MLGAHWDAMETLVQRARGAEPERVIRPETAALVREAQAAGIRLAILSNELDLFYGRRLRERLPLLEAFERIDDATYTGVLKPDPQAYLGCLQALGLQAEEVVFVDDQPRNVDGARRLGIPTVQFDITQPASSCHEAQELLGLGAWMRT
jgi:putative hydrolase of the HAD superfamily